MRILLLGATGAVGRRVVPMLSRAGHHVTAAGRSRERLLALARQGASIVGLNLFDAQAVRRVMAGHDAVVNLATHVPRPGLGALLPSAWEEHSRIQGEGSAILAHAALSLGIGRFVQESFAPIYPDSHDRWISEGVEPEPAEYNRTTLAAEHAAARVTSAGGAGVVLRFAYFYGPQDPFTLQLFRVVQQGWLPIFGRTDGYFSTVSHHDAATATVEALAAPAGLYNVVDNNPVTRGELGTTLAERLGVPPPRSPSEWLERLGGGVASAMARSLRISNTKLREATGWAPASPSAHEGWLDVLESSRSALAASA